MYLKFFKLQKWVRYGVYVGLFVTWGFYISVFICMIYFTAPAPGQTWQQSFGTTKYYRTFDMVIPMVSIGFAIDIYILCLPMAAVSSLRLDRRKKIKVLLFFATGGM